MPEKIRERKDIIDLRPIPTTGPKSFSYRWKMQALLELNEVGRYVLPFSRRVVHDMIQPLWSRSHHQPPPEGYDLCGCTGCEHKSWADHIIKDDDDDETSPYGNIHIYYRYDETDTEDSVGDDNDDDDDEEEEEEEDGHMDHCVQQQEQQEDDDRMDQCILDEGEDKYSSESLVRSMPSSPVFYFFMSPD